jgi:ubiquinone/menaquinone biosynthesis C-methylase UbiE
MTQDQAPKWRTQFTPWKSAGNRTETSGTADQVVRETGWVFNNETGSDLTLADFVRTGDQEVRRYMHQFGFSPESLANKTLLEIGSGIGRMTSAFTQQCFAVVAADVDAAFLERCHETVGKHGQVAKLRTCHVADGSTLQLPDSCVDIAFSYITLQHCQKNDALSLTTEAMRVTRVGGTLLLNYRTWVRADALLVPLGIAMRRLWRVPVVGKRLAVTRWSTRLGWQANRLSPDQVLAHVAAHAPAGKRLANVVVHHSAKTTRTVHTRGVEVRPMKRVNKSHWWLSATVEAE